MSDAALMARPIFYLHGFASSAKSTKAAYLSDRFRDHGMVLRCPDFNQPDFSTMTLTRMLDQLGEELAGVDAAPAAWRAATPGGTWAILAAERFAARIGQLVLFAPSVMFAKPGHHLLPPEKV